MLLSINVHAQNWSKVFTAPTLCSSAFFSNPNEGCVGTGNYPGGFPAQIYYTRNGGATWNRSLIPNMQLLGQVTDIFFKDKLNGWATIREAIEHGWSGVYKTIDGGETWQLWYQADFPVAIREIPTGIFFTDRSLGIKRSVDGGQTFQVVAASNGALGLDFMNDRIGISSSEGKVTDPLYITLDGGNTWNSFVTKREAWSTFGDFATKRLFIASERDNTFPGIESFIGSTADSGVTITQQFTGKADELCGSITGNRGCRSVIYAQKQTGNGSDGLIRSTNGGASWIPVGGPYNFNDKRIAVTGRGAVVYAFDRLGGVWKTTNGGDGLISGSILTSFQIVQPSTNASIKLCDSLLSTFTFRYTECDSVAVVNISFLDDSLGELTTTHKSIAFGFGGSKNDSIKVLFKPERIGSSSQRLRFTLKQADGFFQDTIITINLNAIAANDKLIVEEALNKTLDFGTRSVCSDDSVRIITITNIGCATISLNTLLIKGPAFSLLSNFIPTTLDPGVSRQYLVRFKPTIIGAETGSIILQTGNARDSITLTGIGRTGNRGYALLQTQITSTICDSIDGFITIRNTSCTDVKIDSILVQNPFRFDAKSLPIILASDSVIVLHYHFVPSTPGKYNIPVTVHSKNVNDPFDTTLVLSATATEGLPNAVYSTLLLAFDSVSICSFRELELTIINTGCDTLNILSDTLVSDTASYHIVSDISSRQVLRNDTVKIRVRFRPTGSGVFNTILHITTNIGKVDITITGVGSSDPGILSFTTPTLGNILTCKDTTFSITLENTTCDSLSLDSVQITGIGSADYSLISFIKAPLPIGTKNIQQILFIPQVGGVRDAVVHYFLHKSDGSIIQKTVTLQGTGVQPVPMRLSIPTALITGAAGSVVQIPMTVLDASVTPVASLTIILHTNTDLLSPNSFDLGASVLGGATIRSLNTQGDSIVLILDLANPIILKSGLLGTLLCDVYVSDTLNTDITPLLFSISDVSQSTNCLPTQLGQATTFAIDSACGITTLSKYLARGINAIVIESISPNPARSEITFSAKLSAAITDNLSVEILDENGKCVQQETIPLDQLRSVLQHTITLTGASGARILKLHSGTFEAVSKFILTR